MKLLQQLLNLLQIILSDSRERVLIMDALGMIEVYGYLSAVEALDSALKAANVSLHSVTKVQGGLVTVMIVGDVGAVKAAMDASAAAVERIGRVVSVHVIPRPAKEVSMMAQLGAKNDKKQPLETKEIEPEVEVEVELKPTEEIMEVSPSVYGKEELEQKTVEELRHIARSLPIESMTKNEIKFAKKGKLIEQICKFNKGGDK